MQKERKILLFFEALSKKFTSPSLALEMASFGERQLAKFGWEQGDGLGKNKQGIFKAPNLSKKSDQIGIGLETNRSDQFFP